MADNIKQNQPELDLGEQQRIRQEKLKMLQEEGKDPFVITKYDQTHHSADVKDNFDELEGKVVRVAGRMMSKRVMGKASFCNIQDLKGNIQSYVARDSIGEEEYKGFKKLDIGDIIGIEGEVFKTKTGDNGTRYRLYYISPIPALPDNDRSLRLLSELLHLSFLLLSLVPTVVYNRF